VGSAWSREAIVEGAEDLRGVDRGLRAVETGPPGEEDLRHEIQNQLLGLLDGVYRGEQTGHLPERPELEDRVVERGLALEQDAPKLEHHAEPERERHGHRPHLADHRGVGMDDDLGLTASEPGHLDRLGEPRFRAYTGDALGGRHQPEPDPLALEAADQRHTAALEQLSLGSREPARGGKSTGETYEGGWRRSHVK
jgi:hypothetical protein